jgi:mono/diheme cytochrome c family protein
VYLLLFPAVAVYYYLVPRYAGRPLVAGNVIAVAWVVAVVANVVVWAHHVYLDYPQHTVQGAINLAMQPTTFALVMPSALSIYSLVFTIYRSNYVWDAAGTALFLGIVSWTLAGLSGIVNATIKFDLVVHNTLWIVGHFHQMALLNIGFVIFAATYAFLPQLTGHALYSERLGQWHIWITFWCATANSALWIVQGLDGAPRRWAVLPHHYAALSKAAVPIVIVMGLAQVLFAYNVVQTIRGREAAVRVRTASDAAAGAGIMIIVLGLMFLAGLVGWLIGHSTRGGGGGGGRPAAATSTNQSTSTSTTTAASSGPGKAVFASAGCANCHTLKAAGASGTVGPNLDQKKPPLQLVVQRVTNGKRGMPSFKGQLTPAQIRAVAAFVAQNAGK